jgi:hypothetical protein
MFSCSIIPDFQALKYRQPCLRSCFENSMVNHFGFRRLKKALGYGIIPTVAFSTLIVKINTFSKAAYLFPSSQR